MLNVLASYRSNDVRRETFNGTEHLVVPVVALVEGVVWPSNAPGPELALASEFGKAPEGWDGRPVVVQHPANGSANTPENWETEVIGQLFNTKIENSKLITEAWIDLAKAAEIGGDVKETVDLVEAGEIVEVSTGLFANVEAKPGRFNNEEFIGVWNNVIPDHLALLPPGTVGACSIADGCGTNRSMEAAKPQLYLSVATEGGINFGNGIGENYDKYEFTTTRILDANNTNPWGLIHWAGKALGCGPDCACANCKEANMTDDAGPLGPESLSETGYRHYISSFDPLSETEDRRNARLAAYETVEDEEGWGGRWLSGVFDLLGFRQNAMTDRDRRTALDAAMTLLNEDFFFIVAVMDDSFVFEKGFDGSLFKRNFEIKDDGTIVLIGEPERVRQQTEFVSVNVEERNSMEREERVNALIANSATRFDDSHRDWLMGLEEAQLDALEPTQEPEPDPNDDVEPEPGAADAADGPQTVEDVLDGIQDVQLRSFLANGVRQEEARIGRMIDSITTCSDAYTREELKDKSSVELEKLAKLAGANAAIVTDFSGAAPLVNNDADARFAATPPKLSFEKEG